MFGIIKFFYLRAHLNNLFYCKNSDTVLCASVECDLMFVNLKEMKIIKQMAGYNDELFAACLISEKTNCLAVANNSLNLLVYNLANLSCHLISGKYYFKHILKKLQKLT